MMADRQKILVVDDDPAMQRMLSRLLGGHYDVVSVADGDAALMMARAASPSLVLLDLGLPNLDGRQVLAELRADPAMKRVPVIVITGRSRLDEDKGLDLPVDGYFSKPFDIEMLRGRIQRILTRKGIAG